ncbi:cytochrome P450 [Trametes gibbosa]|nr:cytochrome P450 [Trametes gibbosa]
MPEVPSYLLIVFVAGYPLWFLFRKFITKSPLDNLPGPPPPSSVFSGHFPHITARQSWKWWRAVVDTYGPVSVVKGVLGMRILHVSDPKALHSILIKDAEHYPKRLEPSTETDVLLGPGLFTTQGSQNKKQRKLLNPVFSIAHLRDMTPTFYGIVHKVHNAMEAIVGNDGKIIDVNEWMARTTLEVVGQAALGYSFDDFTQDSMEAYGVSLKTFFPILISVTPVMLFIPKLSWILPTWLMYKLLHFVPTSDMKRMMHVADMVADRSRHIIKEKKSAFLSGDDALAEKVDQGDDIMSLLLRANTVVSDAEKHTDEELIAQISTFVLAGMDTTSNALSRILHLLALNPSVQEKVRAEIREVCGGDDIAYDDFEKLPYLEAVCRETLRLHAPIQLIIRAATKDMSLPLLKPVHGLDGSSMSAVPVPKGTVIFLNLGGCNTHKDLWGEDAYEWKPERWLGELPEAVEDARIPGVYSSLMSFSGGGRSCIASKFSMLEIILAVLLSTLKFEISEKPVAWNSCAILYPTSRCRVRSTSVKGIQSILSRGDSVRRRVVAIFSTVSSSIALYFE